MGDEPHRDEPVADLPDAEGGDIALAGSETADPAAAVEDHSDFERRLGEISADLAGLRRVLDERLRYDATKEESFRQLYEDLERFRALASGAQHKPVLIDIIMLLDRVEKGLEVQLEDAFIASIRDELSEILARRGVSAISATEEQFDPQCHRAVGTRPAADESAHNRVAEIARTGYEHDGQVLRATEVIVYRHAPHAQAP